MKGTSMTAISRAELKGAQTALAKAERKLETARAATGKARALLTDTVREAEDHEAIERRASVSFTERIKAAIKGGAVPSFDHDTAKNAAASTMLETHRQAAEQVFAALLKEELEEEDAIAVSREAVSTAIRTVMTEEARALAKRWRDVEAEARSIRVRLGRFHGPMERLGIMDDEVWRALQLNTDENLNLEEHHAVTGAWTSLGAALARHAEAKPDFAQVDRVREDLAAARIQHQAEVKAITGRMAAERART
jgi:hypothetical protein